MGVAALQAGEPASWESVVLTLPEQWWFLAGCVAFGLAVGLYSAATLVDTQHRGRRSGRAADSDADVVNDVLWQLRGLSPDAIGADRSGGPLAADAAVALANLPALGVLLAFGRGVWWVVANAPGEVGQTVGFLYGVMFTLVPFALAGVGLVLPVCVGVVVYVDTLLRAWKALPE
jgi:hypothetical protein